MSLEQEAAAFAPVSHPRITHVEAIWECGMCDGTGVHPLPPDPRATTLPALPNGACHSCRGGKYQRGVVTLAELAAALGRVKP